MRRGLLILILLLFAAAVPGAQVVELPVGDGGEGTLDVLCPSAAGRRRVPARTSMFVRRLVSGVRSSCDASATSWRCECTD